MGRIESSRLKDMLFNVVIGLILTVATVLCILPFIHIIAVSLSSRTAAAAGKVTFWPVDFTFAAYQFVFRRAAFWKAFLVTFQRIALAVPISMTLLCLTAYPLSKEPKAFRLRTVFVWIFFFAMLFSGGLIPRYLVVKGVGLIDSIWALVWPVAMNVFNMILLLNFFRQVPKALEEAAYMDGAGHWTILWRIFVPLSLPAIATLTLFTLVAHWNAWFDGLIYMNSPDNYPLQTFLRSVVIQRDMTKLRLEEIELVAELSSRTLKSAQIMLGAIPILMAYPFLQRYFVKGITLGSVKE